MFKHNTNGTNGTNVDCIYERCQDHPEDALLLEPLCNVEVKTLDLKCLTTVWISGFVCFVESNSCFGCFESHVFGLSVLMQHYYTMYIYIIHLSTS